MLLLSDLVQEILLINYEEKNNGLYYFHTSIGVLCGSWSYINAKQRQNTAQNKNCFRLVLNSYCPAYWDL